MSRYLNADELHSQGWVAARYINWEPTPLNDNFRLEVEVKPLITFPAADVVEVRHGKWEWNESIKTEDMDGWFIDEQGYVCSECGFIGVDNFNYCPNCGAKMDEVTDGE